MAITSIGNDPSGLVAAELLQRLGNNLGSQVGITSKAPAVPAAMLTPALREDTVGVVDQAVLVVAPQSSTLLSQTISVGPQTDTLFLQTNAAGMTPGGPQGGSMQPAQVENIEQPSSTIAPLTVNPNQIGPMQQGVTSTAPTVPALLTPAIREYTAGVVDQPVPVVAQQSSTVISQTISVAPQTDTLLPQTIAPGMRPGGPHGGMQPARIRNIEQPPSTIAPSTVSPNQIGPKQEPYAPLPISDVASVLMSEVATADITKLSRILDPAPDPANNRILDSLLVRAVEEVVKGNAERAVGYLADYATRDPRRAEALPMEPDLAPVRDKIDSMVSRMTIVAKISAEDGLSRAEQTASDNEGKLSNWDTHADVLIKMAHRFFEAGGYANYSRTSELARAVSDSVAQAKPAGHALAAAASAASPAIQPNQSLQGVNVPYWATPDVPLLGVSGKSRTMPAGSSLSTPIDDVLRNLGELKKISTSAITQMWARAPLLLVLLIWLFMGLAGGTAFSIACSIWPDRSFIALGNFAFNLWGIGFLAMVGFGFYARIRQRP